jgi:glutamate synthase domain-containing protein 3
MKKMSDTIGCGGSDQGNMHGQRKDIVINASGKDEFGRPLDYRTLNLQIRKAVAAGSNSIVLEGIMGQRYIGSAACQPGLYIGIKGTPGNNLGAFLDGPTIEVFGNAQDMTGNTMNSGRIIVHGNAWDVTGLAARGGRILIKGSSGYRVGIHMKEYAGSKPTIIIGGTTGDYLGEYMAGGTILVLGQGVEEDHSPVGSNMGAGMHGGSIYVHGKVENFQLGSGVLMSRVDEGDVKVLEELIADYEKSFDVGVPRDWDKFVKLYPASSKPFRGHFDTTTIQ